MIARALLAVALVLEPASAIACAVCLDSAFGSRGFNLAFVGLMLAPFVVIAAVGGVFAWLRPCGRRRAEAIPPEE